MFQKHGIKLGIYLISIFEQNARQLDFLFEFSTF